MVGDPDITPIIEFRQAGRSCGDLLVMAANGAARPENN
jgi:hypothetical protein